MDQGTRTQYGNITIVAQKERALDLEEGTREDRNIYEKTSPIGIGFLDKVPMGIGERRQGFQPLPLLYKAPY